MTLISVDFHLSKVHLYKNAVNLFAGKIRRQNQLFFSCLALPEGKKNE